MVLEELCSRNQQKQLVTSNSWNAPVLLPFCSFPVLFISLVPISFGFSLYPSRLCLDISFHLLGLSTGVLLRYWIPPSWHQILETPIPQRRLYVHNYTRFSSFEYSKNRLLRFPHWWYTNNAVCRLLITEYSNFDNASTRVIEFCELSTYFNAFKSWNYLHVHSKLFTRALVYNNKPQKSPERDSHRFNHSSEAKSSLCTNFPELRLFLAYHQLHLQLVQPRQSRENARRSWSYQSIFTTSRMRNQRKKRSWICDFEGNHLPLFIDLLLIFNLVFDVRSKSSHVKVIFQDLMCMF